MGGIDVVAERAKVSPANLDQVVKGVKLPSGRPRGVGPQLREKLTQAFPDWLTTDVVIAGEPRPSYNNDFTIMQYETGGAMGAGVLLRDQPGVIKSWRVSREWIQKNVQNITSPSNLAIVTGFGDSMKGMFNPGDPLLVDTGVKTVAFDGVYFFRIGDEGFIKRLQRIPGVGLRAISENKAYESWDIRNGMDFEVFARVVRVWKGEDY
jgi:phage repressor protein C with HTH and peptisase S24 domain